MPWRANAAYPPIGSLGSLAVLVSTPVWCGGRPVKIEVREEQHNESTTCAFWYDAPSAAIRMPCGIVASSSYDASSISTITIDGRPLAVSCCTW